MRHVVKEQVLYVFVQSDEDSNEYDVEAYLSRNFRGASIDVLDYDGECGWVAEISLRGD